MDVFEAVADPQRRRMIALLMEAPRSVNDVAAHFDISRPAVSKHLKVLRECDIVSVQTVGRERQHRMNPSTLKPIADWVNQYEVFWDQKLASLKKVVED